MQQSYIPETEQQKMYNEFMQGTPVLPSAVPTKADTLAQRKQEKVDVLASKISSPLLTEGMPHLDSNEYEMDGYLERGGNKLFNTLSDHDMQAIAGMAIADYQLQRDADGSTFYMQNGEKVKYDGDAQFLYGYGNDEGMFKLGTSRGDLPSADYRYQPGRAEQEGYSVGSKGYGWAPGPEGLDVENRQMEILLPAEIAKRLEYMYHGREGSLDSRALRKPVEGGSEFDKQRDALGSGYTEYYTDKGGLFGDSRVGQQSDVNELYQQFLSMGQADKPRILSKEEIGDLVREREAAQRGAVGTTIHEAQQAVSGVLSGIGKGAIDLVDAGQELITWIPQELIKAVTGNDKFDIDLIPDEFKADVIAGMDRLTGYDRRADEITFQKMVDNLDKSGIKITSWDTFKEAWSDPAKRALVLGAAKEAGMNPSLVLSSIAEFIGSGGALGAVAKVGAKVGSKVAPKLAEKVGKITQTNNAVIGKQISQVKNSGLSKADKLVAIKELEKTYNLGKRLPDIMKGTVYSNADMMVRVNNDLTEFEKNNGGEPADFHKTLEIVAINRVLSAMEVGALRFVAKIGSIPKELIEGSVAKGLADAAGHIIKSGAVEGVQETIDGIAEQITQKLGSKEYEDKTVRELMDDVTGEILAGTMLGVSGGTMVSAGEEALESGTLGAGAKLGLGKIQEGAAKVSDVMSRGKAEVDPEVNEKANEEVMAAAAESAESIWESIVITGAEERIAKGELEGVNLKELTTTDLSDAEWNVVTTKLLQSGTPEQLATVISSLNIGGKSKEAQVLGQKLLESDPNNWSVQGSDPIALDDAIIAAAVARLEAEDSPEMIMDSIRAGIGREFTEEKVNSIVQEAVQEVEYARTLKTLGEVTAEASTGSRGFMTYYSKARYGETQEVRDFATNALGKFAKQHEDKLVKVDEAKAKVVNDINNDRMKWIANRKNELKEDFAYKNAPASLKTDQYEDMLLDMVAYKKLAAYYGGSAQTSGKKGANTVKVDYGTKNAEGVPYAFMIGKWTVAEELHDDLVTQLKEIEPTLDQNYKVIDKAKQGYLDTYKALQGEVEAMQGLLGNLLNRGIREVPVKAKVMPEPTQEKPIKEQPAGEPLDLDGIPDPVDLPDEGDIPSVESIPDNVLVGMDLPIEGYLDLDPSEFTLEGFNEGGIEGYEDILSRVAQQEAEASDKTPSFIDTVTEDVEVPEVMTSDVVARLEAQRNRMKEKIKEARKYSKEYNDWENSADNPVVIENANLVARDPSYAVSLIEEALGDSFVEALLDNRLKAMQEKAPGRDFSGAIGILRNRYIDVQNKLSDELRKLGCK